MFPEILSRVKQAFSGFGARPIELDLKAAGGLSFDAINVGWYSRNGFPGIYSILSGGMPAWSGEPVSVDTALNHSVVFACMRILANGVGQTPCLMYQEKGNDPQFSSKEWAKSHPMFRALRFAPNEEISALGFTEMLTGHCAMQGNAYAQILRRSGVGTAVELHALAPQQVYPDRERDGQKRLVYVVKEQGAPDKTYTVQRGKPHEILHIRGLGWDGLRGYSTVTMARQSLGTALSTERNVARFFASGGRLPYLLQLSQKWKTNADADQFRTDWERTYSEPHRAPMLEPHIKYEQIGLNAADSQLLETRQFGVPEICRWFGVSPHLAGDLSKAPYAAIEQLALEFAKFTLGCWLKRWEEDLWRCVLTPDEKEQGYHFFHDVDALMRGDFKSRMEGYSTMLQNGIASVNEVRYREGMNPIEGGDDHHIQLNMQSLPGGEPTSSQSAALVKIGAKKEFEFLNPQRRDVA